MIVKEALWRAADARRHAAHGPSMTPSSLLPIFLSSSPSLRHSLPLLAILRHCSPLLAAPRHSAARHLFPPALALASSSHVPPLGNEQPAGWSVTPPASPQELHLASCGALKESASLRLHFARQLPSTAHLKSQIRLRLPHPLSHHSISVGRAFPGAGCSLPPAAACCGPRLARLTRLAAACLSTCPSLPCLFWT